MAYVAKPTVKSRTSWGATATTTCSTALPASNVKRVVIHHCAYPDTFIDNLTEAQHQKKIQDQHKSQGWCDIGYHFAVGRSGGILEGMPLGTQGIQVVGYNSSSVGVVVHGDYQKRVLTPNQKDALIKIVAWLCSQYGLGASTITYHGALTATACPGTNIINQMSSIRSGVHTLLNGVQLTN